MRTIEVSTAVFAKIWSHRQPGEETENAILERILGIKNRETPTQAAPKPSLANVLWRQDVRNALITLGGEADLKEIYAEVRNIRRKAGRSLPINTDPIVRRELETNSSHSEAFTGDRDWFRPVNGIGGGRWALMDQQA